MRESGGIIPEGIATSEFVNYQRRHRELVPEASQNLMPEAHTEISERRHEVLGEVVKEPRVTRKVRET